VPESAVGHQVATAPLARPEPPAARSGPPGAPEPPDRAPRTDEGRRAAGRAGSGAPSGLPSAARPERAEPEPDGDGEMPSGLPRRTGAGDR
jgi:hypothetical protein